MISATTRLAADGEAPAAARRFVAATPREHAARLPFSDVLIVLSELATNAVQAGAAMIDVHLNSEAAFTRIAVTYDADGWPIPRRPGPTDVSGGGLMIVEALTTRWGVTPANDPARGKQVWAVLAHSYRQRAVAAASLWLGLDRPPPAIAER
jgi:hypothetical protein